MDKKSNNRKKNSSEEYFDEDYNFNTKKIIGYDSISKGLFIFIMFMGLMISIFSIMEFVTSYRETSNYENITGTVVYVNEEENSQIIHVTYQVKNIIYQTTSSENSTVNIKKGDSRHVKYNPSSPDVAKVSSFDSNALVFAIGMVFTLIALILMLFKDGRFLKAINILISVLISGFSLYMIVMLSYEQVTYNPITVIKAYPISIVMYLGFLVGIGLYIYRNKKDKFVTLEFIEKRFMDNKYIYIFQNDKPKVDWLKYYCYYSPTEIDMFEEVEKFKAIIGDNCMIEKNEELKDTEYKILVDISTVKIESFIPKK